MHTAQSDKFRYYLQPNELNVYRQRYIEHNGRIDKHSFDWWLNQYFLNMHQNVFVRIRAVVLEREQITKKEIEKLIIDFEKQEADKSDYPYLGTENKVRIDSFVRLVAKWADDQNKLSK